MSCHRIHDSKRTARYEAANPCHAPAVKRRFGRLMRAYREQHGQVMAISEVVSLTRAWSCSSSAPVSRTKRGQSDPTERHRGADQIQAV